MWGVKNDSKVVLHNCQKTDLFAELGKSVVGFLWEFEGPVVKWKD